MIVAIHQPEFMPYGGFFAKMLKSDAFIILDNIQGKKNHFDNRNKIIAKNKPAWITVPMQQKGRLDNQISHTSIIQNGGRWQRKIIETLKQNYGKHPFSNQVLPHVISIFEKENLSLCELNIQLIRVIADNLQYPLSSFTRSSEARTTGSSTQLLVNLLERYPEATYLSGPGGASYMQMELFGTRKILFHKYHAAPYPQPGQNEFIPNLSIVDMLCCIGYNQARELLLASSICVERL